MNKISNLSGAEKEKVSYIQQFRDAPEQLKKRSLIPDLRVEKIRAEKLKKAS
jgi:hypothetical protein